MISNGFNETKVLAVLRTRIGWYGSEDPAQPIPDAGNLLSKSGRHYEDFHASVTTQAVNDVIAIPAASDVIFNRCLSRLKDSVIMNSLNSVFRVPQIVDESKLLYHSHLSYTLQKKVNNGLFVGQMFRVAEGDYSAQMTRVGLLFDQDVTFNLYLFSSLKTAPVFTIEVNAIANDQTFVDLEDWVFDGKDDRLFYFGYFQDELQDAQAINIPECLFTNKIVFGVSGLETVGSIEDLSIDKTNVSLTTETYGLNPEIGSYRDYTNSIIKNAHLFDEMQGLQMAIQVVSATLFSTRSNITERLAGEAAMIYFRDLNTAMPTQKEPFEPGLKSQIKEESKRLRKTFFPIPCFQSHNIHERGDTKSYNHALPKN
jgi:hypothetical protein